MGTTSTLARRGWRQWRPDEARAALSKWKSSGLPLATFARQLGVSNTRLRWWRDRLGEWNAQAESTTVRLVPAVVTSAGSMAVATVQMPGGVTIEVADTVAVPAQWVAAVARELSRS